MHGPDAGPPSEAAAVYPDPVDGLLHAAAANRPLEDVARLITLLEQSEGGEDAAAGVLRVVGTDRPLEDVPRLVTVLSRPPHHAEHAGHMIRAAAESRSVEEVTRLMALLYREPLEPHCGEEAVRTAATHRPVEEVVELVERLARERAGLVAPPSSVPQGEGLPAPSPADPAGAELRPARPPQAQTLAQAPDAPPDRPAAVVPWTAWATAVALALCATAYVPVRCIMTVSPRASWRPLSRRPAAASCWPCCWSAGPRRRCSWRPSWCRRRWSAPDCSPHGSS
ncbi:hypothetical protein [Streptomyces sp. NPDC058295]|uniref:hypothetical protein n=1 Tax=Streptomyces sp. NPDC058295 TaxID=3346431 RepID=UPI0036E6C1EC